MKILQRYIIRELTLPFVLSCLTLNFIFMAGYLVKAANFIIGRGVPLWDTLYVLSLALPDMISYTVPMSLLMSVLIVYGNFSQHNEIRAIKASGINPLMVMTPAFLIGVAVSLFMFVFNDQVTTAAGFELRKTTKQMLIKHPNAVIEPGRFVKLSDTIIFLARKMEDGIMKDIIAYENTGKDKPIRTIIAERGKIISNAQKSKINIELYDGSISDAEESSVQSIQFKTYAFPSLGQEDVRNMRKKMKDLTLAELILRGREKTEDEEEKRDVRAAFHGRIAFSLGCFLFVFLGIPVAILVHRGEIVVSFAISMAAASLYYILFVGAKTIAVEGMLPAIVSFWIPNLLMAGAGGYFLRRSLTT